MQSLRRLFTKRSTILSLIILILAAMLLASFVPQTFLMSKEGIKKWHSDYPAWSLTAEKMGLTSIYTHPLFALVLLGASASLAFSSLDSVRRAVKLSRGTVEDATEWLRFETGRPAADIEVYLRKHRYSSRNGSFVRYAPGYWGAPMLHIGFMVVIIVSLWMALTQRRGLVSLVEGEAFVPGQAWLASEEGLLVKPLILDDAVRLDGLDFEFWPSYATKRIGSHLTFVSSRGDVTRRTVEVNSVLMHKGVRVYQMLDFGHAFAVQVVDSSGKSNLTHLLIHRQSAPDKPEYVTYEDFPEKGRTLKAKYFAEADRSSLNGKNPELVLRIDEKGKEVGQALLTIGGKADLAGYHFRLEGVRRWTNLTFVRITGVGGLFCGFALICLGCVLHFFVVPRVAVLQPSPGGTELCWRAERFEDFFKEEFDTLRLVFEGQAKDG
ncbi:MAG: hypothetical protein C0404_01400 [Verrucomicrobia bacterium]|nr:hypothetical protein [Verrucomicrobiota bacterium]